MKNLHPLVHNAQIDGDLVAPLSNEEKECLTEIRDVLARHGKLERFGVTLLHKHFDIAENELMIETIDPINRVQTIRPMSQEEIAAMDGKILETCWSMVDGDVVMGCKRGCVYVSGKHYEGSHIWTGQ